MESLRTLFRVAVMAAAIFIAYKAWQHYGPPADRIGEIASRAAELVKSAWDRFQSPDADSAVASADPRLTPAPFATPAPTLDSQVKPAQALVPANEPAALSTTTPLTPPALVQAPDTAAPIDAAPRQAANDLAALYTRLDELGVTEQQLSPWGSGGSLHRFSCETALARVPQFSRHFEAIEADAQAAVASVVAQVEAWRKTQGETAALHRTLR